LRKDRLHGIVVSTATVLFVVASGVYVLTQLPKGWQWVWEAMLGAAMLVIVLPLWAREKRRLKRQARHVKSKILQKIAAEPGVSHTRLFRSIKGSRVDKERAVVELGGEYRVMCAERGRVRRYYPQSGREEGGAA